MVCVDTIARVPVRRACKIRGTKYARLLPTPVPASTTRWRFAASAAATAQAISTCCGRAS